MKSKMIKVAIVVAIVLVAGINVFNAQQSVVLSDIGMENVEALSDGEGIKGKYKRTIGNCPEPIHYKTWVSCAPNGTEECYRSDC